MDKTAMKARATRRLRICAIVSLGLLGLFIISDLLRVYQTRQELVSPLVPDSVVEHIQQFYLEHAIVNAIMLLIAVGVFMLKRYWYTILLVAITLVGSRFLG